MLNFPNSPALNATYAAPDGSQWKWDGAKWLNFVNPASTPYLPLSGGSLSGNLNINLSAAAAMLQLHNTTSGTTATDGLEVSLGPTSAYMWNYENSGIQFGTNNIARVRIDPDGRLNIIGNYINFAPASGGTEFTMQKSASGLSNNVNGFTGGLGRWVMAVGNQTAETGSNVGSDWGVYRFDDAGAYLGAAILAYRSNGLVNITNSLTVNGTINTTGYQLNGINFAYHSGNFSVLLDPSGGQTLILGNVASGGGNYYDNSVHTFRGRVGAGYGTIIGGNITSNTGRVMATLTAAPTITCYNLTVGRCSGMMLDYDGSFYLGAFDGNGNWVGPSYAHFNPQNVFTIDIAGGIRYPAMAYGSGNNIGFGWATYPGFGGNVCVSIDNAGAAYPLANASDARMKIDIEPADFDALTVINQIPLRQFRWLDIPEPNKLREARQARASSDTRLKRIGVIAQEVAKVFPEGVGHGDDTEDKLGLLWVLDTNVMIAALIGAVQQLTARLAEVEAR